MNQIQYDKLQLLLADMVSLSEEDPNTEGYCEAIPFELEHYIYELSDIFKVPIPTKTLKQMESELTKVEKEFFEELKLE